MFRALLICAYLIAGQAHGIQVVPGKPIVASGGFSAWTDSDENLELWINPDDTGETFENTGCSDAVDVDGDNVDCVTNASGEAPTDISDWDFTFSGTNHHTWETSEINSRDCMLSPTGTDGSLFKGWDGEYQTYTESTWVFVFKWATVDGANNVINFAGDGGAEIEVVRSGADLVQVNLAESDISLTTTTSFGSGYHILTVVYDGTNGDAWIYVDDSTTAEDSDTTGTTSSNLNFRYGSIGGTDDAYICEIVMFDGLHTGSDLTDLLDFAATRYGL